MATICDHILTYKAPPCVEVVLVLLASINDRPDFLWQYPPPPPLTDNKRETQQGVRGNPNPTVQFVTSGKGRRDKMRGGKEEGRYRDRVRQGGCEWKRQGDIDGQE
jgi:hypothetical protein